jgi:hypothetical protein
MILSIFPTSVEADYFSQVLPQVWENKFKPDLLHQRVPSTFELLNRLSPPYVTFPNGFPLLSHPLEASRLTSHGGSTPLMLHVVQIPVHVISFA